MAPEGPSGRPETAQYALRALRADARMALEVPSSASAQARTSEARAVSRSRLERARWIIATYTAMVFAE